MPGPGKALVKNAVVAQNSIDYKATECGVMKPGQGLGYDFAGKIIALTNSHQVAGWIVSLDDAQKSGAFREYTVALAKSLLRISERTKDEEAATIPLASFTALMGIHLLSNFPQVGPVGRSILVWGKSCESAVSSVGLTGYKVITTASPRNHALIKDYGAFVVIDYHAPDFFQQIIAASGQGGVEYAFDAISEGESYVLEAKALRPAGPRSSLLSTRASSTLLQEGRFKGTPLAVRPGGLSGIQDGLEFMKSGKVSGANLVYRITDTPA